MTAIAVQGLDVDDLSSVVRHVMEAFGVPTDIEIVATEDHGSAIARIDREHAFAVIARLVGVLSDTPGATPTADELWMSIAHTTSSRSSSRNARVGAAAVRDESLLAIGTNEVPLPGGKQPWSDHEQEQRDYPAALGSDGLTRRQLALAPLVDGSSLTSTGELQELIELLDVERALHAEVSVVTNAALRGISLEGSTVYVTHDPCYRCRRTLLASGVNRVVFDLPRDSHISSPLREQLIGPLVVEQFIGLRWNVVNAHRLLVTRA